MMSPVMRASGHLASALQIAETPLFPAFFRDSSKSLRPSLVKAEAGRQID